MAERIAEKSGSLEIRVTYEDGIGPEERQRMADLYGLDITHLRSPGHNGSSR